MRQRLPQGPVAGAGDRRDQEDGDGAPALSGAAAAGGTLAGFAAIPDADGWFARPAGHDDSFLQLFGEIRVRPESATSARVRFATHRGLRNLNDAVHGGFLLAVVDQALFVGPTACGFRAIGGATVDVSSQFLSPVAIGRDIDAVVEVLRETGRLLFLRGLIEQDGEARLAFSGTIRKPN